MTVKDLKNMLRGLPGDMHIVVAQTTEKLDYYPGRYEIQERWTDTDGVVNLSLGNRSSKINCFCKPGVRSENEV